MFFIERQNYVWAGVNNVSVIIIINTIPNVFSDIPTLYYHFVFTLVCHIVYDIDNNHFVTESKRLEIIFVTMKSSKQYDRNFELQ